MVHQLIINTLMACQKVPSSTVVPTTMVNPAVSTEELSDPQEESTVIEWPEMLPDPIGLDELPLVKPSSHALQFYATEVLLYDLSFYDVRFYDQIEDNPYQYVCERLCGRNPELTSLSLNNIQNCQMDLIQNWKEVVATVQDLDRESLYEQLQYPVGVVECSGSIVHIQFGRAATTPTKLESFEADWGGYFANLAQEEATAVFAFGELLEHLQRWQAPESLQDWCRKIIREERTHALMMSGLAHRNGQGSAVIQFPSVNQVSMKEMAIHNALTGCIGETWSAVLLRYQSEHAPKYNGVFKRIAKDETSHAEFSWVLHEWLMSQLTQDEQTEVLEAMREMLSRLPEYRYATQIGEMSSETFCQAWESFSRQVIRMVA